VFANPCRPGSKKWLHLATFGHPNCQPPVGKVNKLELSFESKELRTVCENEAQAKLELGATVAATLKRRLADMRAAASVKDLLVGHPRTLDGTHGQEMVIDLSEKHRLVFAANHIKNPVTAAGDVDWNRVSRIKMLRLEGTDGQ
jgi:toxin HigB-1